MKLKQIVFVLFLLINIFAFSNDYIIRNFDEAFEIAEMTNKKVVVMFSTDSCVYCRMFIDNVASNSEILKWFRTEFVFVEIKPEKDKTATFLDNEYTYHELFGAFGARSVPMFVFFENDRAVIGNIFGYYNADTFLNLLKYIKYDKRAEISFDEFVKSDIVVEIERRIIRLNENQISRLLEIDKNTKLYSENLDVYTNVVVKDDELELENYVIIFYN